MLRTIAIAALLVGGGMMFGGTMEEVAPVELVEDASACDNPQKGCGGCKVRPGDPLAGQLPYIECYN